ncbi:MAG TPA: class I SAM-dependent methyltransferase [Candidatus Acidoferrales bacterium]|nr:class I SAM-dependent methyltransferase [Candidatus Acidoferrales bacterium]
MFASLISAPRLVGIDSSPAAAARAPGLEAQLATIEELPFADQAFDVVTCNWTLDQLPAPDQGLRDPARVLGPEGRPVGRYYFPGHLEEVWHAMRISRDADGLDAESGRAQLAPYFGTVRREKMHGEARCADRASRPAYLDAYRELAGALVAPEHPYPFRSRRHNCFFIGTTA